MSFTQANRREVESLLSKMTTTGDTVGRMARDIALVVRLNPQWDATVRAELESVELGLYGQLSVLAAAEKSLVDVLNEIAPQPED